jgi:hypothetical protein
MYETRQESRPMNQAFGRRLLLIVGLGMAAAAAALLLPPIAQDKAYHHFADQRTLLGVPNLPNVISNAPFAAVSAVGLLFLLRQGLRRDGGPFTHLQER